MESFSQPSRSTPSTSALVCDGCGQVADQEHIARRLKRLERMTCYRPVHVQVLFLGAVSPGTDAEHLYSAEGQFRGEGAALLRALGIETAGRPVETVLAELQRRGWLLTDVLECPIEPGKNAELGEKLESRIPVLAAKIRRSFKPKRVIPLGEELDELVARLGSENLGAELVVPQAGRAFRLDELRKLEFVTVVTATAVPSL